MLTDISKLYDKKQRFIHINHVSCLELLDYAEKLENLRLNCFENYDNDEHLIEIYNDFKKMFFKFCTSLLPYKTIISDEIKNRLLVKLQQIKSSYPELFQAVIMPLGKSMNTMFKMETNELNNFLCHTIKSNKGLGMTIAIITKRTILDEEKGSLLQEISTQLPISFYTENSFRNTTKYFTATFFLGTPNYFGAFAHTSPKADHIYFISYDIFSNHIVKPNYFPNVPKDQVISTIYNKVTIGEKLEKIRKFEIKEENNFKNAVESVIQDQTNNTPANNQQPVEASVVHLENDRFIFISRDAKLRVYSPTQKTDFVKQIPFRELEEDVFIIIRNESDTKLIADIADQEILKEEAIPLRKMQNNWKQRLRHVVNQKNVNSVANYLTKKYKMKTASPASIRGWCNDDSICPKELPILLEALKCDPAKIDVIYRAMKKIQNAHRQAGRIITLKLMNELTNGVSNELFENGYFTFQSKEFKGASFNIERVTVIDNTYYQVMPYNLLKPFQVSD